MRSLKLIGAENFSSSPRGITAVRLGDVVSVEDQYADELLSMSYMDERGQEIPYWSENPDAPLLFKKRAVTMSMLEAVKAGKGSKSPKTTKAPARSRRRPANG